MWSATPSSATTCRHRAATDALVSEKISSFGSMGHTYPVRAGARVRETHASNPSSDGLSSLASGTSIGRQ